MILSPSFLDTEGPNSFICLFPVHSVICGFDYCQMFNAAKSCSEGTQLYPRWALCADITFCK